MKAPSEPAHKQAIETLSEWAGDSSSGLPEELFLFVSRLVPMINVDLLIRDPAGRTLLTWREDRQYGAGWHIPGGIIRYRETAESRLHATALEELGSDVEFDPEPLAVEQFIDSNRCERGHFISLVYRCRMAAPPDARRSYERGVPVRGQWAWHAGCPDNLIAAQARYRRFF